jgi:hypothetical protein
MYGTKTKAASQPAVLGKSVSLSEEAVEEANGAIVDFIKRNSLS